jgi:putative SOS response-associated peptidase YedK
LRDRPQFSILTIPFPTSTVSVAKDQPLKYSRHRMCGRFVRKRSASSIAADFGVDEVVDELQPSFNIAPTHDVAVIVNNGTKRLVAMRWGLVPAWATDPAIGSKLINARAETLAETAAFKEAFKRRRCLVVADGFYEWQKAGREKTPLLIRLKSDQPFAFAGLYETWTPPWGEALTTCTIITTEPNDLVRPIHDRMPAILPRRLESLWLDETALDRHWLLDMLTPYPAEQMEAYAVSSLVNSVKNDSPACIEPLEVEQPRLLF